MGRVGAHVRYSASEIARLLGLPTPTLQQAEIITAPLEPTLVLAGAGSGKTETMAARVVWLVANEFVRPEEILGLTFTRKAAGELGSRVRARLAALAAREGIALPGEPTIATYHAYAIRVVAEHGLRAGLEPTAQLVGEAVCWQYADAVVRAYDGDMSFVDSAPSTVTASVLGLVGELAEHLHRPAELAEFSRRLCEQIEQLRPGGRRGSTPAAVMSFLARQRARAQLVPLLERYAEHKRAGGAMDFSDQIARAAELAQHHPEVASIERARYRVILLDEYQDTSFAQLTLLTSLFGQSHPVMAVGDPCQSIYGWRGASAGNLLRFPRDFPRRSGQTPVRPLTVSWRNAPAILRTANAIAAPLRAEGVGAVSVPELEPRPGAARGAVECALHSTIDDEAAWVAERLASLWGERKHDPPTTAVLVRKRDQLERLAAALRSANLPVEVVGLGGLLATPEVRDLVATLTVLSDPTAGGALLRLLTGARWRLGPRDIAALKGRARELDHQRMAASRPAGEDATGQPSQPSGEIKLAPGEETSIIEALDELGPPERFSRAGYARLAQLAEELRVLRSRVADPLPELVLAVEHALCLDIEAAVRRPRDSAAARANLDAFAAAAANFADAALAPTLSAFLSYLHAAESEEYGLPAGRVEVHAGAVQLLTIHAAKGLEWDVVAVCGMTKGVFPSDGGGKSSLWTNAMAALPAPLRGDHASLPQLVLTGVADQVGVANALAELREAWADHLLIEERRLAYVAVTRARHHLLCSGYWWGSAVKPRGASAFLEEVRESCEQLGDKPACWVEPPEPGVENPLTASPRRGAWPFDPLAERRDDVRAGAELVARHARANARAALVAHSPGAPAGVALATVDDSENDALTSGLLETLDNSNDQTQQWLAEAELLLAERANARGQSSLAVAMPSHLSVSQLVTLGEDPARLAKQLRRPMPRRPAPWARRGTDFHSWLERQLGSAYLLDLDELPGAADELDREPPDDETTAVLKERFAISAWSGRTPLAVEVPFATTIAGVVIRGRMDAVFPVGDRSGAVERRANGASHGAADGAANGAVKPAYEVIDWKTGTPPSGARAQAAAIQLAAYRLSWAELAQVPLEQVSAGFHYIYPNKTVRPVDLLDDKGLAELIFSVPRATQ